MKQIKTLIKKHARIITSISALTSALAAWALDKLEFIDLMSVIQRIMGWFALLMTLVLLISAPTMTHAQTFEVGYEVNLQSPPTLQDFKPSVSTHWFVYATHDFFLFEFPALDAQVYASPSMEIVFADSWWASLQLLFDTPIATPDLSIRITSEREVQIRASVLLTPLD